MFFSLCSSPYKNEANTIHHSSRGKEKLLQQQQKHTSRSTQNTHIFRPVSRRFGQSITHSTLYIYILSRLLLRAVYFLFGGCVAYSITYTSLSRRVEFFPHGLSNDDDDDDEAMQQQFTQKKTYQLITDFNYDTFGSKRPLCAHRRD